jgi:hypothetical protein
MSLTWSNIQAVVGGCLIALGTASAYETDHAQDETVTSCDFDGNTSACVSSPSGSWVRFHRL